MMHTGDAEKEPTSYVLRGTLDGSIVVSVKLNVISINMVEDISETVKNFKER